MILQYYSISSVLVSLQRVLIAYFCPTLNSSVVPKLAGRELVNSALNPRPTTEPSVLKSTVK